MAETATALPVKTSDDPRVMLRTDLENENETVRNYRQRIRESESLQEYGIGEDLREILRQEQEHQIDLATALGENVPDVSQSVTPARRSGASRIRFIMLTRILAVATTLLALLVIHQYNRIAELRTELADTRQHAVTDARASVTDTMEGQGAEMRRAIQWLHEFYRSPDGLQRSEGLWIDGHPDYEGIGYWIFEVYLRDRLQGKSESEARRAVEDGIRQSEEWHAKHKS